MYAQLQFKDLDVWQQADSYMLEKQFPVMGQERLLRIETTSSLCKAHVVGSAPGDRFVSERT